MRVFAVFIVGYIAGMFVGAADPVWWVGGMIGALAGGLSYPVERWVAESK